MNAQTTPAVAGPLEATVMQHTPGPWEVMSGDNYEVRSPLLPREYPHHCKEDSTGDFVAYIGNHAADFGWANANLIAAAPDLLAALEKMLDLYSAFDGPVGPTVIMARAAIEKAKPEPHNAEVTRG